jgi:hypothetical protein
MPRTTRRRLLAGAIALSGIAILTGCRPNIPLIPGIKSDVHPFATTRPIETITPPDRSPQASPARPHTAP